MGYRLRRRVKPLFPLAALACCLAGPASARDDPPSRPAALDKLLACRTISDGAARLVCADREMAALQDAVERRDVLVADRAEVRKARTSLFGLPEVELLSKGESKSEREEFTSIETTIARVSGGRGGWVIALPDGARWAQNDGTDMARDPRPGDAIRIRKAPVGGYLANISGQRAIRVRRLI